MQTKKANTTNGFKSLSLFCGCGGLDLGFHNSGFKTLAAYDINSLAVQTYNENIDSVAEVLDLSQNIPAVDSKIDVLLAGSPCQGFSVAGKRDFSDPRNSLLLKTGEIALALKPKVLLAENVPGALSGAHKFYWEKLEGLLVSGGYNVTTICLNAQDVGVAQRRKRIFLLAWRSRKAFTPIIKLEPSKTLHDAIYSIGNDVGNHIKVPLNPKGMDYKIACRILPGMKLSNARGGDTAIHTWDIPEVFGKTNVQERDLLNRLIKLRRQFRVRTHGDADPVPLSRIREEFGEKSKDIVDKLLQKGYLEKHGSKVDLTNTFNGKYRRLAWDKPSNTVDTYFGNPRYFLHPQEHRGFTVREAARIQGFPDSFKFPENEKKSMEMIGNAVSPIVAEKLALMILDGLLT